MDTHIVSGPGRQLAAIWRPLAERNVDLQVITFQRAGQSPGAYARFLEDQGIRSAVVHERSRLDLRVPTLVATLAREHGAHLIQSHSYKPAAVAALAHRQLGVPWIGFFHGITLEDRKVQLYNWIDTRLLQLADAAVVVSESQRGHIRNTRGGVRVVPNAVLPSAAVAPVEGPASLPPGPRVGVIGRLSWEKGVDVFLDAFEQLAAQGVGAHAVIVGDGPERAALAARAAAPGLAGRVTFTGHRAEVRDLYPQFDVVVLPSRSEGMPNVLLEALAADRPVVATAVGGVPEILTDARAGAMVPSSDPTALAAAIGDALRGKYSGPEATAGRKATSERFSLAHRADALRTLYDEVLTRARTAR